MGSPIRQRVDNDRWRQARPSFLRFGRSISSRIRTNARHLCWIDNGIRSEHGRLLLLQLSLSLSRWRTREVWRWYWKNAERSKSKFGRLLPVAWVRPLKAASFGENVTGLRGVRLKDDSGFSLSGSGVSRRRSRADSPDVSNGSIASL